MEPEMDTTGRPRARARGRSGMALAAAAVVLAACALAAAGFAALHFELVSPLVARGALVVSLGGAILGGTLSAVGLLVTRHDGARRDRWIAGAGAIASIALLLALVVGLQRDGVLGGPIVVPDDAAASDAGDG
jgi:hypothetical protein